MPLLPFSALQQDQLRAEGVAAVYLFGSRAQGNARETSDYDLALIMQNTKGIVPYINTSLYNALLDCVSQAIQEPTLPTIDLVFLQRVPLYYTMNVLKSGILIYDGNPHARLQFEERARLMYMDFEPYRKELEYATLAMI